MKGFKELLEKNTKMYNFTRQEVDKKKLKIAAVGGGPLTFDDIDELGWRMGHAKMGSNKGDFTVQFAADKKLKAKEKTDFVMKVAKLRHPDAWFIKFE
jgi:hypothetical protein